MKIRIEAEVTARALTFLQALAAGADPKLDGLDVTVQASIGYTGPEPELATQDGERDAA